MQEYNQIHLAPLAIDAVEDNEKIWMPLTNKNGICEIDKKTKTAKIRKIFDGEPINKDFLYCYIKKVNNILIFSPGTAERIAIYNLDDDHIIYIPLKPLSCSCKQNQNEIKFGNILQYGLDVYLLGYSYPAIIKINTKSFEIKYITNWVEEVDANIKEGNICGYFSDGYIICKDLALIPIGCMRAVLELNLKTTQATLRKLKISMSGIGGLSTWDGENIWLVGKGNLTNWICCWNMNTDRIIEIQLDTIKADIFDPFYAPICTDSKIFLMPMSAPYIYEIDIKTNAVTKNKALEKLFKSCLFQDGWKTLIPRMRNNLLTFFLYGDSKWYDYNILTGEIQNYFIHFDIADLEKYFYKAFCEINLKESYFLESKMPLNSFINSLVKIIDKNANAKNKKFSIGEDIYRNIMTNICV